MSLETVRQAILLDSVGKSISLLDRPGCEPVRSLRYFASLLQEVRAETFPDSYRQHLEYSLRRCERIRPERRSAAAGRGYPELARVAAVGTARGSSSVAGAEGQEEG